MRIKGQCNIIGFGENLQKVKVVKMKLQQKQLTKTPFLDVLAELINIAKLKKITILLLFEKETKKIPTLSLCEAFLINFRNNRLKEI